jgi:hypothetical protein
MNALDEQVCSPAFVKSVRNGGPGLTELIRACPAQSLMAAIDGALPRTRKLPSFAMAERMGQFDCDRTDPLCDIDGQLSWRGKCVGYYSEAISKPDGIPPSDCLVDTFLEQTERGDNDSRPNDLLFSGWRKEEIAEFWQCTKNTEAWVCLSSQRSNATARRTVRNMYCEIALADRQSLAVVCAGSLARHMCSEYNAVFLRQKKVMVTTWRTPESDPGFVGICAPDGRMIVPVVLGEQPNRQCVRAVRDALASSRQQFPRLRREALRLCANRRFGPSIVSDPNWIGPRIEFDDLPSSTRMLITRILERQLHLFGTTRLPEKCEQVGGACVRIPYADDTHMPPFAGRPINKDCGVQTWTLNELGEKFNGDGLWSGGSGQRIIRIPTGSPPVALGAVHSSDPSQPWNSLENTYVEGDLGNAPDNWSSNRPGSNDHSLLSVASRICVQRGGDVQLCREWITGTWRASADSENESWRRVGEIVAREFPDLYRWSMRRRSALERGEILDENMGQSIGRKCQALLIDACTGDLAEVCQEAMPAPVPCPGRLLSDKRCEILYYKWVPLFRLSHRR